MTRAAAAMHAGLPASANAGWAGRIRTELLGNILPFWARHAVDRKNGGFYGTIASDLTVHPQSPRSAVVASRILWTYAAATRLIDPSWREIADWAFDNVMSRYCDRECGGVYWMLDFQGAPISTRKQTYAEAFAVYALSEYHRATGSAAALDTAKQIYGLMERHCYDPVNKGYFEARGRQWQALEDMRLSDKDLNSPKSMNTHLHVLEAYTNLLRLWPDDGLKARHKELIQVTLDHIVDGETGHFKLFFDERWNSLSSHVSFGHDIEGSWLLKEAADVLGDAALLTRVKEVASLMAHVAADEGLDQDGSLFYEADGDGRLIDAKKHWWAQAEAVVGFYNAYEMTGDTRFRTASQRVWNYIEDHVVDRVHGEWHAKLSRDGIPLTEAEDPDAVLVGPWKCPYHNARVCFEMLERLGRSEKAP